eukprot:1603881-Rhodomonas_salina.1
METAVVGPEVDEQATNDFRVGSLMDAGGSGVSGHVLPWNVLGYRGKVCNVIKSCGSPGRVVDGDSCKTADVLPP